METTVPGVAGETRVSGKIKGRYGSVTSRGHYVDIVPRRGSLDVDKAAGEFMQWMENSLPASLFDQILALATVSTTVQQFDAGADLHFHCIPTTATQLMDTAFIRRSAYKFLQDIRYFPPELLSAVLDRIIRYREARTTLLRSLTYGHSRSDWDQSIPASSGV